MKTEELWKTFQNINNWIQNCDYKIMILFGFLGSLGIIATKEILQINLNSNLFIIWIEVLLVTLFLITYFTSVFFLFSSINPNIKIKYSSNIFFGSIANKNFPLFKESLLNKNYNLNEDLLKQIHINSKIAKHKFKNFRLSLFSFGVSLIVYVILNIFFL